MGNCDGISSCMNYSLMGHHGGMTDKSIHGVSLHPPCRLEPNHCELCCAWAYNSSNVGRKRSREKHVRSKKLLWDSLTSKSIMSAPGKHLLDLYIPDNQSCVKYRDLDPSRDYRDKIPRSDCDVRPWKGPLVVFIHGGGWRRGYKQAWEHFMSGRDTNLLVWIILHCMGSYDRVGQSLAQVGLACAVVSYPLVCPSLLCDIIELCTSFLASVFTIAPLTYIALSAFHNHGAGIVNSVLLSIMMWNIMIGLIMTAVPSRFKIHLIHKVALGFLLIVWVMVNWYVQSTLGNFDFMFWNALLTTVCTQSVLLCVKRSFKSSATWRHQVASLQNSIRWLLQFGKDSHTLEADGLYLMGHSAGGHLASVIALEWTLNGHKLCAPLKVSKPMSIQDFLNTP